MMNSLFIAIFFLSLLLLFYTYVGYPILLGLFATFFGRSLKKKRDYKPSVTLLIAAYNEEKYIGKKIDNSLALDYPKEKLEIIVFSDASDDKTDEITSSYAKKSVKLLRIEGRVGKTACQNESVKVASGEVIVFTDARALFDKSTVSELVKNFSDESVGAVIGKMSYKNKDSGGEGLYWRIEQWMKERESTLAGSTAGTGSVYAVRKKDYVPLPAYAVSDFIEPIAIFVKNKTKPYVEPKALCFNISSGSGLGELKRHERIITRYHFSKKLISDAYNPFKCGLFSFQLLSHRSLRFIMPFFLILTLFSNMVLAILVGDFYIAFLFVQFVLYLFAIFGFLFDRKRGSFLAFSIPYHFVILNLAALKAWTNYLKGKNFVTWKNKGA